MLGATVASAYSGTLTPSLATYRVGGGGAALTLPAINTLTGANHLVVGATGAKGTVLITNSNNFTGSTTINSGTLQLGNGISDGAIPGTSGIVNNSTLAFNPAVTQTFTQSIGGTGALTKLGAGTLILSGASSYSGATTWSTGVLQLANSGALGASSITTNLAAVQLQLAGDITLPNTIRLLGSGLNLDGILKNVSGSNTLTDFGIIAGGTRVNVAAGSTLNLPNAIVLAVGGGLQNFRVIGTGSLFLGGNNSAVIGPANLFLRHPPDLRLKISRFPRKPSPSQAPHPCCSRGSPRSSRPAAARALRPDDLES